MDYKSEDGGSNWAVASDTLGVYSGTYSPTLTLTNVPASFDGYQYRCRVVNRIGGATDYDVYSNVATLTVIPALTVEPKTLSFTKAGGTIDIDIKSNASWEISTNANWLTFARSGGGISGYYASSLSGNGTTKITVKAAAYSFLNLRFATFTIKAGSRTETVSVTQTGN